MTVALGTELREHWREISGPIVVPSLVSPPPPFLQLHMPSYYTYTITSKSNWPLLPVLLKYSLLSGFINGHNFWCYFQGGGRSLLSTGTVMCHMLCTVAVKRTRNFAKTCFQNTVWQRFFSQDLSLDRPCALMWQLCNYLWWRGGTSSTALAL